MIVRHLKPHLKKDPLEIQCDECKKMFIRPALFNQGMKDRGLSEKDLCSRCWRMILNNRPEYKRKMSFSLKNAYIAHPERLQKKSESMKRSHANVGEKNGMKKLEPRKRVSEARKIFLSDPKQHDILSNRLKERWKRGEFEGVRLGQCKWFTFIDKQGRIHKVQGTWELKFIEWLDKNGLNFTSHRGHLPYTLNGTCHSYHPDFWVNEWQCFVEVKCRFFFNEKKFQAIQESNPHVEVRILFKEDLNQLGVKV